MISVEVLADSIGDNSPRLFTIKGVCPKFIHQESLRHRMVYIHDFLRDEFDFSLSVSSARAIPFKTLLEEVRNPNKMAKPVKWGREQKGMSPADDEILDPIVGIGQFGWGGLTPERCWEIAATHAANFAEGMANAGVHKSIINRIIEPYIHTHAAYTAVEAGWMNFFGLRLDKPLIRPFKPSQKRCGSSGMSTNQQNSKQMSGIFL